jgi:hypothetical protein
MEDTGHTSRGNDPEQRPSFIPSSSQYSACSQSVQSPGPFSSYRRMAASSGHEREHSHCAGPEPSITAGISYRSGKGCWMPRDKGGTRRASKGPRKGRPTPMASRGPPEVDNDRSPLGAIVHGGKITVPFRLLIKTLSVRSMSQFHLRGDESITPRPIERPHFRAVAHIKFLYSSSLRTSHKS